MTQDFEIGDRVMTLTWTGPQKKGTVVTVQSSYEWGAYTWSYGVRIDGDLNFNYYSSYDLSKMPDSPCTCGAVTAHKPNTPPGHAHYCDVLKDVYANI